MGVFDEVIKQYEVLKAAESSVKSLPGHRPAHVELGTRIYRDSLELPADASIALITGLICGVYRDYDDKQIEYFKSMINKCISECEEALNRSRKEVA